MERVTGIEPALSAWELDCHVSLTSAPQVRRHLRLSVSTRHGPLLTLPSGTQRARRPTGGYVLDRFIIRESSQELVLSYLDYDLLPTVCQGPAASVLIRQDRYSVGYSPAWWARYRITRRYCTRSAATNQRDASRAWRRSANGRRGRNSCTPRFRDRRAWGSLRPRAGPRAGPAERADRSDPWAETWGLTCQPPHPYWGLPDKTRSARTSQRCLTMTFQGLTAF